MDFEREARWPMAGRTRNRAKRRWSGELEPRSLDAPTDTSKRLNVELWRTLWNGFYPRIHDKNLRPDRCSPIISEPTSSAICRTCFGF